jgi:hypothetical protein
VVLAVVGLGCATACVLLGHGDVLLKVLASIGGVSGALSLLKGSPIKDDPTTRVTIPEKDQ